MKRKNFFKYLVFVLIVPCIMICSACTMSFGKSAYDIAVENGFVGTEAEWLASLKGADGSSLTVEDLYNTAVQNGYTGTMLEFINEKLNFSVSSSDEIIASKAILSAVKVISTFQKTETLYDFWSGRTTTQTTTYTSNGAGVIYELSADKSEALIITNYHVVYDKSSNTSDNISDDIGVYIYGNQTTKIPVTYIGGSLYHDIAVLKVENNATLMASDCRAVDVADSDQIYVGETAIAIGNPEALGISVASGIVSVDSEKITMTGADGSTKVTFRVIRVDTAINSGNSGGGLFDKNGNLIGIVNAKTMTDSSGSTVESIGYAIPANIAVRVANAIYKNCKGTSNTGFKVANLGLTTQISSTKAVYDSMTKLTKIQEVVTAKTVSLLTPAKAMGISENDVISKIRIVAGSQTTEIEITREFQIDDAMLLVGIGDQVTIYSGETAHTTYTFTANDFTQIG